MSLTLPMFLWVPNINSAFFFFLIYLSQFSSCGVYIPKAPRIAPFALFPIGRTTDPFEPFKDSNQESHGRPDQKRKHPNPNECIHRAALLHASHMASVQTHVLVSQWRCIQRRVCLRDFDFMIFPFRLETPAKRNVCQHDCGGATPRH